MAQAQPRAGAQEVSELQEYLRFLVTLTAVLDPFLAVPIFLTLTASQGVRARVVLGRRAHERRHAGAGRFDRSGAAVDLLDVNPRCRV